MGPMPAHPGLKVPWAGTALARHLIKQILYVVPTMFGVLVMVFLLIRLTPGDPAIAMLGPYATSESIAALRASLKLDEPLHVQFFSYLGQVLRGDLGQSLSMRRPVMDAIIERAPYTAVLALAGTIVSIVVGVPIGVVAATMRNSVFDRTLRTLSLLGVSMPVFFSGLLLILLFSVKYKLFPVTGAGEWSQPMSIIRHLVLPALAIGLFQAALVMRLTRSAMLEVLGEDYIRTAKAKGLPPISVIFKHALKNSSIPIITAVGLYMGQLFGGAVVTETLFARPGLGRLLLDGVISRDYPLVQGVILIFALGVVVINLLVDLTYALLDPRVRQN